MHISNAPKPLWTRIAAKILSDFRAEERNGVVSVQDIEDFVVDDARRLHQVAPEEPLVFCDSILIHSITSDIDHWRQGAIPNASM